MCDGGGEESVTCALDPVTYDIYGDQLKNGLVLKATGTFGNKKVVDAVRAIGAKCEKDVDCPKGTRCCSADKTCHEIVGLGEECDCQRPCSADQGCFPGTCGEPPRRCRPGCFPGDPADYNNGPENCTAKQPVGTGSDERDVEAFCAALPDAESNSVNKGGACAPSNECDVVEQNCPDAPRNRDLPESEANPVVPYTCAPVLVTSEGKDITACYPAGPLKVGEEGCTRRVCGEQSATTGCAKGLLCVKAEGSGDDWVCKQQCGTPSQSGSSGSSSGCSGIKISGQDTFCSPLLPLWGDQPYATGVCDIRK